jgi:hypothetical protein
VTNRRKREFSLWPLLLIPIIGGLLVAGALLAASAIHPADTQARVLDSMQRDARSTTPSGMTETSLRRYACGTYKDDSAPSTIVRTLRVNGLDQSSALHETLAVYRQHGWSPNRADSSGESLLKGEQKVLRVTVSRNGAFVTVGISDGSILC